MDNKLVMISIAAVIGIIVLGSVLMPILDDSTATTDTFTNEGYFYMQKITSDDDATYTISYRYDNGASFKYGDAEIPTNGWPSSVTIATDATGWVIRAGVSEYIGLQGIGYNFSFGGHNSVSAIATFSNGTATVTRTILNGEGQEIAGSTLTTTYDELWLYSPDPTDYIMKKADTKAYLLDDDGYTAVGVTTVTSWNTVVKITGNVDDYTATIIYPPNITTTVTNKEIVKTQVDSYVDLYQLDKLTFTINDGTTTVDATYSYFIVPSEVTAERSVHFTPGQNAIFAAIPVLIILAVLLGVVALVIRSRMD